MRELIRHLQNSGLDPVWFHPVREDWRDTADQIPRKGEIDAIVVNGEGSIHHSETRPRARFLPQLGAFARDALQVPSFLINASVFAIDEETARDLAEFDRIFVRESASQAVLRGYGVESAVIPDLTFQAALPTVDRRRGIAGTDSVIADSKVAIRTLCKERGYGYRGMVSIPKDMQPDNSEAAAVSAHYCRWLASHELIVTGRFHTVTLCLATRTPFIAVESNTPKISAFVHDVLGSTRRVVSVGAIRDLDLKGYAAWQAEEKARIDRALTEARAKTRDMFAGIRDRL